VALQSTISTGKVILLIEDMRNLRVKMKEDLNSFIDNLTFLEAENLSEAYAHCEKEAIDMIISDWNLPDGIGYDLLLKIKEQDKFKNTPFLMCTTMDNVEDILNAIAAGADEYLVKPWSVEELQEKVINSWNNHNS
jgi:two-component system chemotaxis response regulator CheY